MELPMCLLCLLLHAYVIIRTGCCQEQCGVSVVSNKEFVPFGEWALLNCTYNCSTPTWESNLLKRNQQAGDNWVSTEVQVDDWEKSTISCVQELDDGEIQESIVEVAAYALPWKVTIDLEKELQEGQRQTLTCTVFDVAPLANLRISAMRGPKEIVETSVFEGDVRQGLQTLAETFEFDANRRDNFQDFYCLATLKMGSVQDNMVRSESINVKTYAPPDFASILVTPDTTVHEHESLNLTCYSEGFPEPKFFWIIPFNVNVIFSLDKRQVIITKATLEHSGTYECEARNSYGRVRESKTINIIEKPTASLQVPHILVSPDITVKEGGSFFLTCHSIGIPEPEYSWTVPSNAPVTYSQDKSKVVIAKATSAHNGTYTCQARNKAGQSKQDQIINVIGQHNGVFYTRSTDILLLASALASILLY